MITITVAISFVGLAIDIGNLYRANLRVQKSADAGSLSALKRRILFSNSTKQEIENTAKHFALANYQIAGVSSPLESDYIDTNSAATFWDPVNEQIVLTVKQTSKLLLLSSMMNNSHNGHTINRDRTSVRTSSAQLGRANISLIIDSSQSMDCPKNSDPECSCRLDNSCSGETKIDELVEAIIGDGSNDGFLQHFNATRDRVNIVAFNTAAAVLRSSHDGSGNIIDGFDLVRIANILNNDISPQGATNIADGLMSALDDYQASVPNEDVTYVLFSDGSPNAARTFFLSRGNQAAPAHYINYAIDYVDDSDNIYKGVSPFVKRFDFNTDPTLSLYNHINPEPPKMPESGDAGYQHADTANERETFHCGNAVQGCDYYDPDGNLVVDNSCTVFEDEFAGNANCSMTLLRYNPNPSMLTGVGFSSQYRDMYEHFYNSAIVYSDLIRQNNGSIFVIGLGPQDLNVNSTNDPYQDAYNSFYRKDFFLNRIAQDTDGDFTRLSNFNYTQYNGGDLSASEIARRGDYLATHDTDRLRGLYIKIARKILFRLVR